MEEVFETNGQALVKEAELPRPELALISQHHPKVRFDDSVLIALYNFAKGLLKSGKKCAILKEIFLMYGRFQNLTGE